MTRFWTSNSSTDEWSAPIFMITTNEDLDYRRYADGNNRKDGLSARYVKNKD